MKNQYFVVLGGKYEQVPLIKKLKSKGLKTIVFDYNQAPPAKRHCDIYFPISYHDIPTILKKLAPYNVVGIATIGTNDAVYFASSLSLSLGIPSLYDSPSIIKQATYKSLWRPVLSKYPQFVPAGNICKSRHEITQAIEMLQFPVIIKPADASGSKGISVLHNDIELNQAIDHAFKHSKTRTVILERFVGHNSYAIESFITGQEIHLLTIGKRTLPPAYHCVGLGISMPCPLSPAVRQKIIRKNQQAIQALKLNYGPVHIDMVLDENQEPYIVDIGPRLIAGPTGWSHLQLATGVDVLSAVINQAMGIRVDVKIKPSNQYYAHRYITSKQSGVLSKLEYDEEFKHNHLREFSIHVKPGDRIHSIRNSNHRYGYITALAETYEELNHKIDSFLQNITFHFTEEYEN